MIRVTFSYPDSNTHDVSKEHFFTSNRKAISFIEAFMVSTMEAKDAEVRIVKTALTYLSHERAVNVFDALYHSTGDEIGWKLAISEIAVNS